MSRPSVRFHLSLLLSCFPLFALSAQQRRSFEPGGPESLVLAGSVWQMGLEVEDVVEGFSITMDAKGKVVSTGGESKKVSKEVNLYQVLLFVDEAGVREALRLAGVSRDSRGTDDYDRKIQEAVRKGAFPKLLVLRFTKPLKARVVRENLASELAKYPGGSGSEAGRFTSFLRKDFVEGDEVEIRLTPDGTVRTTVKGNAQKEISSPEFADAIFSIWLMMYRTSVMELNAFVAPKPGA